MTKPFLCACGETDPKKFYGNNKGTCKSCQNKKAKALRSKPTPINDEKLIEKFNNGYIIDDNTGCWMWNGRCDNNGYGRLSHNGRSYATHRLSYELIHKEPPGNLFVCHKCDTPGCVNPEHLFLGTNEDNMKDMAAKGRGNGNPAYGVDNNMSILTEEQAQYIIDFNHYHGSLTYLAKKFNTSPQTIYYVKHRKTWKHLKKTKNNLLTF